MNAPHIIATDLGLLVIHPDGWVERIDAVGVRQRVLKARDAASARRYVLREFCGSANAADTPEEGEVAPCP